MGSLFSAPKAPPPPPPLPTEADGDEDERKSRLEILDRKRRGRAGLIATSPRGLMSDTRYPSAGKTLLGE